MTARTIALLAFTAAVLVLVLVAGHKLGRWSRRHDYADGWDQAQAAERERWEEATGVTYESWQAKHAAAPGEWPYGFTRDPVLPETEVLLAEADAALGKPPAPAVPSVAEVDELAERYPHRSHLRDLGYEWRKAPSPITPETLRAHIEALGGTMEPIVADLTGAAAWHYPGEDDVPTLTGLIVRDPRDRIGPEWLQATLAAMDSETDAYLRRQAAEVALFRRGITTGAAS